MGSRRNGRSQSAFDPILHLPVLPTRSARASAPARTDGWSELTAWKDHGFVPFELAWEKWRRSGGRDGVAGLKAFVLAVENGCVPPGEILQWIASAFERFYADETPIERLLQLGAAPGERSPLQAESDWQGRQDAVLIMARLVAFGAQVRDAATMAHACWRRDAESGRTRSRVLSVSTLESAYRRWSPAAKRAMLDGDRAAGGRFAGWRSIARAMTLRDLDKHLRQIPNTSETAPVKAKLRGMYVGRAGSRTSHRPFG